MAKILIIDDDAEATNLLQKLVKLAGHKSAFTNDSTQAIGKARAYQPDVILMDLMMPDLDGFQLCAQFNNDAQFSKIPIIIISAMEDSDSKARAFNLGAREYITKPFDIDELTEKINRLLG